MVTGKWKIDSSTSVSGIDVPGKNIIELLITPQDVTHAIVTGSFADHSPVTATGTWDDSSKSLQVDLKVRDAFQNPSNPSQEFVAIFHSLQIQIVSGTQPKLSVIDNYGSVFDPTENRLFFQPDTG